MKESRLMPPVLITLAYFSYTVYHVSQPLTPLPTYTSEESIYGAKSSLSRTRARGSFITAVFAPFPSSSSSSSAGEREKPLSGIPLHKYRGGRSGTGTSYLPSVPKGSAANVIKATIASVPGWREVLKNNSDANGVVAFVCGTLNYADLMNSFYQGSIRPSRITNFIFVALTDDMCDMRVLHPAIPCVQYPRHYGTSKGAAISWGTARFAQVVQVKTDVLLGIVQEGFTGLLMDADLHLFRNPMPELARLAEQERADLVIQDDMEGGRNSGFMYLRPSDEGAAFAVHVVGMQRRSRTLRQQEAVNRALRSFRMRSFRVFPLPQNSWPCGEAFFNKFARRVFAWSSSCSDCILVHNNWILGDDAKEYRAKEFLQWTVDSPGGGSMEQGYYTSPENRFLVLGNPDPNVRLVVEEAALKAAFKIGKILNRSVIIPWLRCRTYCYDPACRPRRGDLDICPLHARYYVRQWNEFLGRNSWREAMFRYNPLTHQQVRLQHNLAHFAQWAETDERVKPGWKDPTLPTFGLKSMQPSPEQAFYVVGKSEQVPSWGNVFHDEAPKDSTSVVRTALPGILTREEIDRTWGKFPDKILRFHSLYHVTVLDGDDLAFDKKWVKAMMHASIRQV